jgi:hypothetical protein
MPEGYGQIGLGGRGTGLGLAHRVAYELLVGPILEGLHLDHLCRNRKCVNPDHLEPVTPKVNANRGFNIRNIREAAKLYCVNGHARDLDNIKRSGCPECARERARAQRKSK